MDNQPYNKLYSSGDYLLLELISGDIFEGEYYKGSEDRIELINATEHNNPSKLNGIYCFYRTEIFKISLFRNKPNDARSTSFTLKLDDQHDIKRIKITQEEYERLRVMSKNYIYIQHVDDRYYTATEELSKAESIGVAAVGLEARQAASITLLVISTWQKVYIFDMIHLRNSYFYPELKEIFESAYTCKVIHNSSCLIEILSKKYKLLMENIFDTYLVDLVIEKNKRATCDTTELKGKSLSESLSHYLYLPSTLLQKASQVTLKDWYRRPLSENQKLYAAQFVMYLIVLKDALEKMLFGKIYSAIENYQEYYSNLNLTQLSILPKKCSELSEDINKLIPDLQNNKLN